MKAKILIAFLLISCVGKGFAQLNTTGWTNYKPANRNFTFKLPGTPVIYDTLKVSYYSLQPDIKHYSVSGT